MQDEAGKKRTSKQISSIAKITRPHVTGILPRTRLYHILDSSRNLPVTFIISPPGSGKTSLVSGYLSDRKIPCLWYSIDRGDQDIATFFHYMELALRKAFPKTKSLPWYTPDYAHGVPVFARRYFGEVFSRIKMPFMFVFDNYQDVPTHSHFHAMINHVLSEVPEGINFIILSRKEPPPAFARLHVHGMAHIIGWDTIRFTREEARELIENSMPGRFPDKAFPALYEKTDGWAAGLMLSLKGIEKKSFNEKISDTVSSQNIFDYFAHEVFYNVNKDRREFLLKTSFLPTMSIDMTDRLTGMKNADKILDNLIKECCFIETYSQGTVSHKIPVYRYHMLFREFLLFRAKSAFDPAALSLIKHDAAVLLEESGNIEDAVQLLHESGDVKSLIPIISKWAPSLIRQGRYQTLQNYLEFIPGEVLSDDPYMLYWSGVCRLPFHPGESQSYFEKAFHTFQERNEAAGSFLSWAGLVESIILGREGLRPLDHLAQVVEQMVEQFQGYPSEDIEVEVAWSVFRILTLRKPQNFDAEKWLNRIRTITEKTTDIDQKIKALTAQAGYLYSAGKFGTVETTLETLQDMIQKHEVRPLTLLTVNWLRAAIFNVMSMYEECRKVVSEGLELAQSLKIRVMEHMMLGHGVISSLKQGDLSHAKQYLQKMASASSLMKPYEASFYHYCAAWGALYQNNLSQALTHADNCLRLCEDIGNPWTLSIAHVLKAYLAHAFGENKKALKHLSQARSIGIQSNNEFTPFICLLTEAYFFLKEGKELPALEAIRKGMHTGREKGFMNLFMCEPVALETIVTKALEHGIEETYVKTLIQRNAILPNNHHGVDELWPWPLKIYTLGRFGLIKDGNPVRFTGKIQQKPLSMLKALIAFGGREVSEERLVDIIWPDAEGDTVHSSFATTLSRLRQLLGTEHAVKFQDRKAALDQRYCYVDVWAFERILGKADTLWTTETERDRERDNVVKKKETHRESAVKLTEKALRMYTGPFLAGDNEPWMVSIRERLRNKILRTVKRVGVYYEEAGELEKAVECYQKGLEVDDLIEEFYRRMMACYKRLGKKAEALSVYNRCCKILSAQLAIEPAPETEALVREIKR
jgi:LuxR family maltose regulon positive regulatory protein